MNVPHFPLCGPRRGCLTAGLGLLALWAGVAGYATRPESVVAPIETPADADYWPPAQGRDLLAVDDAMRNFFAAYVNRDNPDNECLRQIVAAILRPDGLGFAYDSAGTYDARETFRRRRGNCQGFAFLVVAVAREYGLKVRFQDLGTMQKWNRFDRFVATVRHTNVRMASYYREDYVVDLRPDLGQPSFATGRYVVNDDRAFAHFYSTAGFFRLVAGDRAGALRLMQLGADHDPSSSIVWTNLGHLRVQLEQPSLARTCFEKALRLDASSEEALAGLVNVLRNQGGPEDLQLAAKYERRTQAYRDRNPYYAHHLACAARERGDWAEDLQLAAGDPPEGGRAAVP